MRPLFRYQFDNAMDPQAARNALGIVGTGGGGGGAPTTAEYITSSTDATLTNERVLTDTATITWDFSTPGQAKASTSAGGGNVSNSGTPTSGQYAKWVTATTIQGVSTATVLSDISAQPIDATLTALAAYNTNGLLTQTAADTFTGRTLTGPAAGITVSNGNGVAGNPTLALANDLAALEGLSGTNTIPYRSGTDTWGSVTVSTGLSFSGGTLSCTVSTAGLQPLDSDLTDIAAIAGVQGDIIIRGASAWQRLGAGTSGQFLQTQGASTNPQWATLAGGGNVSNSGTPAATQYARWVTSTTIEGRTTAQVLSDIGAQAADADLTSWAAITRASGFDTFVATPNSANLATLVTNETGSGALVFATSPTLVTPLLGTPTSGVLTNCTGLPTILAANEATDTTCFPAFFTAATGELGPKTNANLTYNSSTGALSIGTAAALTAGTMELGAASDTTLSRSAAGTLAVEGVNVPTDKTTPAPQCGRLEYVSATAISFKPFNGDRIKINGVLYAIPSAGIAGVANTGVFVGGVAGQNLAAGGTYNVYAFNNGGTITADFVGSATAHATSATAGNVGTEIKSGDDTRTLIGKVITNASAQFVSSATQRFVISWFNRRNLALIGSNTGGAATTSTSFVELTTAARIEFLTWGDEHMAFLIGGAGFNGTSLSGCYCTVGLDGTSSISANATGDSPSASGWVTLTIGASWASTEGYHFVTPLGAARGSGTATYYVAANGITRG